MRRLPVSSSCWFGAAVPRPRRLLVLSQKSAPSSPMVPELSPNRTRPLVSPVTPLAACVCVVAAASRLVRAPAAVSAPVPPLATATVPMRLAAARLDSPDPSPVNESAVTAPAVTAPPFPTENTDAPSPSVGILSLPAGSGPRPRMGRVPCASAAPAASAAVRTASWRTTSSTRRGVKTSSVPATANHAGSDHADSVSPRAAPTRHAYVSPGARHRSSGGVHDSAQRGRSCSMTAVARAAFRSGMW